MKKTTLIIMIFMSYFGFAQNTTTGVVQFTSNFSVQFDVNASTDIVTMTMVGPSNVWLGVALNISSGNSMGSGGEDVIIYDGAGLSDRYMTGYQSTPHFDTNDWTVLSETVVSGVITIVATRDRDTGNANDFTFPTTNGAGLPMLWAIGNHIYVSSHGSKGAVMSSLGISEIDSASEFNLYPNPVKNELTVEFPAAVAQATISVYSILGILVYESKMDQWNSKINTSDWNSGVYLMNVSSANFSQTKRIIKQ